jgi:hypothetical protein
MFPINANGVQRFVGSLFELDERDVVHGARHVRLQVSEASPERKKSAAIFLDLPGKMYGPPRYCKVFVGDAPVCVNVSGL